MIDLKNLILNSSFSLDISSTIQDNEKSEQLIDITEYSDEGSDLLTPESFVLLMAEIIANSTNIAYEKEPQYTANDDVENDDTALQSLPLNDLKTGASTQKIAHQEESPNNQLITEPILFEVQEGLNLDDEYMEQLKPTSTQNVALAWIDSENFEPPMVESESSPDEIYNNLDIEIKTSQTRNIKSELLKFDGNVTAINTIQTNSINQLQNSLSVNQKLVDMNNAFSITESIDFNSELKPEIIKTGLEVTGVGPELLSSSPQMNQKTIVDYTPPTNLSIPIHVKSSQWSDQLSEHIVWLGHQEVKSALIKIHPEELGPLEINVKVVKDNASVNISTHSAYVRELVDQAVPRLREMMAQQGINLSEVHIGPDTDSRQNSQQNNDVEMELIQAAEDKNQVTSLTKRPLKGLVDYFA